MFLTTGRGNDLSEERQLTPLSVRMKEAAKRRGLTADQIADELKFSSSTVRHYWTARSEPSIATLERYAAICGVSLYWLVTGLPDQRDVVTRLSQMLTAFRTAVIAGEAPLSAWERLPEPEKRALANVILLRVVCRFERRPAGVAWPRWVEAVELQPWCGK